MVHLEKTEAGSPQLPNLEHALGRQRCCRFSPKKSWAISSCRAFAAGFLSLAACCGWAGCASLVGLADEPFLHGVVALYVENVTQVTHVAHVTNMLLLLHALWYQCYHREIRAALLQRRFWTTRLYPQWVHALGVFYLGLFYGLSGLMKLLTSGPSWANGVSLQLWTNLWGDPDSLLPR